MSTTTSLIFLFFLSCVACVFSQYVQYPYNYGYPVSGSYGYRSPCQSSCGSVQSTSRCQYLPCYQQNQQYQQYPPYYPYAYNYNYNANSNSRRVVNPYAYQYPRTYLPSSNSYANIPVEIVDDVNLGTQKVSKLPAVGKIDEYANVPVEIIDDDGSIDFWRNIPKLPKVTQSSHSNYSVSQGGYTSDTTLQSKPVRAIITRTFQPLRKNPIINLDFVNGEAVNKQKVENEEEEDKVETTTEPDVTTTEESEDVSAVKSWF